ncbi:hypothetical protein M2277_005006 [Paenibacillus sp. LBL]|uniref:hypothetical protein n=1 Tax=Paenibacillus sp. LBL TaxID=2940563 RepID=UPI002474B398|nr:hypothetical protein [Paenibacillus sp. LBL]MDH6674314.1 hypothetical protein [Paenibacillus sp. LBL]
MRFIFIQTLQEFKDLLLKDEVVFAKEDISSGDYILFFVKDDVVMSMNSFESDVYTSTMDDLDVIYQSLHEEGLTIFVNQGLRIIENVPNAMKNGEDNES